MIKKMIVETYSGRITAEQQKALETLFGSRGIQAATIFHAVGHRLGEKRPISTVVLLQLIKGFLESIRSEYPLKIHHSIAERTLIALKVDASQEHVEALAAEICSKLCTLGSRIFLPQALLEAAKRIDMLAIEKGAPPSEFSINEGEFHADLCNSKRGVFTPLEELQFLLDKTGENGRALSKKIKADPQKGETPEYWFVFETPGEQSFFNSKAFIGLGACLWQDVVEPRVAFNRKYPPVSSQKTFHTITSAMIAKSGKREDGALELVHAGNVVARAEIPLIASHLITKVFSGTQKLNTVTGHKALRYAVSLPFKQRLEGAEDFRVKAYDGGFAELSVDIGLSSKHQFRDLQDIFYALKHLQFSSLQKDSVVTGRLIDIATYRSPKTGREDGLILTILPALVGYEALIEGTLLIPVAQLAPPTEGIATNFHAGLYLLQMLIIEQFSKQSINLSKDGFVRISESEWLALLGQSNLPHKMLDHIRQIFIEGCGEGAPSILKSEGSGLYSLAESYEKQSQFLIEQGERRQKQAARRKRGIKKRWNT